MLKFLYFNLLLTTMLFAENWTLQHPFITNNLNDIHVFDDKNAIIVGEGSAILYTIDGGENWMFDKNYVNKNYNLKAVQFLKTPNEKIGWVVGDNNIILKTTDLGVNWSLIKTAPNENWRDVCFLSENSGWIVSEQSNLYKTIDGGQTWELEWNGEKAATAFVHFDSENIGWFIERRMRYTINGGNTWMHSEAIQCMQFSNSKTGYGILLEGFGGDGFMMPNYRYVCAKTDDGGTTWEKRGRLPGSTNDWIIPKTSSIFFINELDGWVTSNHYFDGGLFKTIDGGRNWEKVDLGFQGKTLLSKIVFSSVNHGWVIGEGGLILKTLDGGKTWQSNLLTKSELYAIQFDSNGTGYSVGENGSVLLSNNDGVLWNSVSLDVDDRFRSISTFNSNLYITGWKNFYHKSVENSNWAILSYPDNFGGLDGFFIDSHVGWVTGGRGIIHTTNGGKNWTFQFEESSSSLYGCYFKDSQTGWAVGWRKVLYTENSGQDWKLVENDHFKTYLFDVYFVNDKVGWIVGDSKVLKTIDSGKTWVLKKQTGEVFYSVFFIDEYFGWIVGGNGKIYHTTNGGDTWRLQSAGVKCRLNSVFFSDKKRGWVVGENGFIFYTENGGDTFVALKNDQPTKLDLLDIFPNPFNSKTTIKVEIEKKSNVNISIYNVRGRKVNNSFNGDLNAGVHYFKWDGCDDGCVAVSSGIYFVRLETNNNVITRKLSLIR